MNDRYLNIKETYTRLEEEYKKYGSLVVAYDFDNTVYDYHGVGDTYTEVISLLRMAKEKGCYLIVFTALPEEQYSFIKGYLNGYGIPFDAINEDAPFVPIKSPRKIYFNILLDDRAGLDSAFEVLKRVLINN